MSVNAEVWFAIFCATLQGRYHECHSQHTQTYSRLSPYQCYWAAVVSWSKRYHRGCRGRKIAQVDRSVETETPARKLGERLKLSWAEQAAAVEVLPAPVEEQTRARAASALRFSPVWFNRVHRIQQD